MYKLFLFIALCFSQTIAGETSQNHGENHIKIAVIGAHDPKYDHIGIYSHANKQAYAMKHGYGCRLFTEYLDPVREGYWYKILAVQKCIEDYDWVFYLDSDALIMNDTIKLESLIDDNYDLIATADGGPCPILSGQFLIKNSEWSKQFLSNWYSIGNTHIQPGYDGGALIKLFSQSEDIRSHIKILPIRMMGSYPWDYKEGDFAIQFAGYTHSEKARLMKEYYDTL